MRDRRDQDKMGAVNPLFASFLYTATARPALLRAAASWHGAREHHHGCIHRRFTIYGHQYGATTARTPMKAANCVRRVCGPPSRPYRSDGYPAEALAGSGSGRLYGVVTSYNIVTHRYQYSKRNEGVFPLSHTPLVGRAGYM